METDVFSPKGRIRRSTYWERMIAVATIGILVNIMVETEILNFGLSTIIHPTLGAFTIIQGIKRMHDVDKSGWYQIIPIYGFVLSITDGTPGNNEYGENPKEKKGEPQVDVVLMTLLIILFITCGVYALLA